MQTAFLRTILQKPNYKQLRVCKWHTHVIVISNIHSIFLMAPDHLLQGGRHGSLMPSFQLHPVGRTSNSSNLTQLPALLTLLDLQRRLQHAQQLRQRCRQEQQLGCRLLRQLQQACLLAVGALAVTDRRQVAQLQMVRLPFGWLFAWQVLMGRRWAATAAVPQCLSAG
jgi:hypothetical protein